MQDSGQGNGRDPKGRFVRGHSGNPQGRKPSVTHDHGAVRMDSDGPSFGNLPGEHIEPQRIYETIRLDGWQNSTTGLGMPGFDKTINNTFVTDIFSRNQLVELWRGDDICARVIETLPKEAFKKGYELNIADEGEYGDLKDQVEQAIDDLELNEAFMQTLMMERGFGGAALLIGANDGQDMSMPLNMDTIMDLHYVTPLEPDELSPLTSYTDRLHPKYGKTELYQITALAQAAVGMGDPMQRTLPSTSVIHETRLIVFPGLRISKHQGRAALYGAHWGDSVLNRVVKAIATFNMGYANTGIILSEQGLPIFHMKELAKLVNANRSDIVKARLSLLFQQMSTARAAVIDSEENYERKAMPLNGLAEILDRLAMRVAAAVEMPVTKLMGQSPKGLGNEGESDMETWYDHVATYQDQKVRRPLRRLLQIVMRARRIQEPLKWSVKFHALKQLSDAETAQARNAQMTIDTGYVAAGILTVEEVRNSRFSGEYSHETQLDDEAWAMMNAMGGQPGQMTPEDMMAMGLDPNNPDDVAKAQGMMGDMGMGMPGEGEVDPETGEPIAPEGEVDPETGEPLAPADEEVDPETGEPLAAQGEPGAKPSPFGAKPATAPGAKPGMPGKPPVPGAKPAPFGKKPGTPEGAPGEKPAPFGKKPAPGEKPAGETPPEEGKGKVLQFGKKPAPGEKPVDGETPPEGEEEEQAEKTGDSPFANSERKPGDKPAPEKQGPTARGGETDEDRQRMASQRPGTPLHVIDRDKNGKISPAEAEAAGMSLDDIIAQIDALNQELNGGGKLAPVVPDENGEVPVPEGEEGEEPAEGEEGLVDEESETPVEDEPEDEEEEAAKKKPLPFAKRRDAYNPDQPRDEGGEGGGQWVDSGGGGGGASEKPRSAPKKAGGKLKMTPELKAAAIARAAKVGITGDLTPKELTFFAKKVIAEGGQDKANVKPVAPKAEARSIPAAPAEEDFNMEDAIAKHGFDKAMKMAGEIEAKTSQVRDSAITKHGGDPKLANSIMSGWIGDAYTEGGFVMKAATAKMLGVDVGDALSRSHREVSKEDKKEADRLQRTASKFANNAKNMKTFNAIAKASQELYSEEKVTLYRGIGGKQASQIREAVTGKSGKTLNIASDVVVSFTEDPAVAKRFAEGGGVIVKVSIPRSAIVMSHRLVRNNAQREKEVLVATKKGFAVSPQDVMLEDN